MSKSVQILYVDDCCVWGVQDALKIHLALPVSIPVSPFRWRRRGGQTRNRNKETKRNRNEGTKRNRNEGTKRKRTERTEET